MKQQHLPSRRSLIKQMGAGSLASLTTLSCARKGQSSDTTVSDVGGSKDTAASLHRKLASHLDRYLPSARSMSSVQKRQFVSAFCKGEFASSPGSQALLQKRVKAGEVDRLTNRLLIEFASYVALT